MFLKSDTKVCGTREQQNAPQRQVQMQASEHKANEAKQQLLHVVHNAYIEPNLSFTKHISLC